MTSNNTKPEHTVFCPESCSARHNEMILALAASGDDNRKPADLAALKVALYSHLQNGWNAQTSVPDALPEFRFPLVQWACVLGKTQALSWLLTKMKFKAFVTAERTGETGLHRALRLLHQVRSRDATPRSVHFISSNLSLIVHTLTEQDPHGLFLKDKVQGNSVFHMCALCISQQESISSELDYYENCMQSLLQRVTTLQTMEKLSSGALHMALNSQNDRGETILHILARNNISIKTVKCLLSDYKEVVDKTIKNHERKTPLDVARDRKADLVEKVLDCKGYGLEHLARQHPDLYQLYTQDLTDQEQFLCNDEATPSSSNSVDNTGPSQVTKEDAGTRYSLRVGSFLQRKGFYCTSSQQSSTSQDDISQDEEAHSPSVLDTLSVSFPASFTTNTESVANNDSQSTDDSDSENATEQNEDGQESCVSVVVENSVLINLHDEEKDGDEELHSNNCAHAPRVVNCAENGDTTDLPSNSIPCSESVQLTAGESGNVPEVAREDIAESTCSACEDQPSARENGVCSSLAKVIRQESDVVGMLVARLQDKKEQNRVELRRAQRELIEKQSVEIDAANNLQQLKAELENLCTQKDNLEQRRQELLEELKNIEGNINQLQEQSVLLQTRVNEQARVVVSIKVDREKASEECASLKRKFTEYSEALSDICSTSDEPKAKKERSESDS